MTAVRSRTPSPESCEFMDTHERCVCFTTRVLSHSNIGALTPPGSPTLGCPRLVMGAHSPRSCSNRVELTSPAFAAAVWRCTQKHTHGRFTLF